MPGSIFDADDAAVLEAILTRAEGIRDLQISTPPGTVIFAIASGNNLPLIVSLKPSQASQIGTALISAGARAATLAEVINRHKGRPS